MEKATLAPQLIAPADLANLNAKIQQGEEVWITKPHESPAKKYKLVLRNGTLQYEWEEKGGVHRRIFDPAQENFAIAIAPGAPELQDETTINSTNTIRETTSEKAEKTTQLVPINGTHVILLQEIGKIKNLPNPPVFHLQHGINGPIYPIVFDEKGNVFYKDENSLKLINPSSRENWYFTQENYDLLNAYEKKLVQEKKEWLDKNRIRSTDEKKKTPIFTSTKSTIKKRTY